MTEIYKGPSGRNLTLDEVEALLDVLENLIAITGVVEREGFYNPADCKTFVEHRDAASVVWSKSVAIIDGEEA